MNVIIIPQAPEERYVPDDFAPMGLADSVNARAIKMSPLTGLRTGVGHVASQCDGANNFAATIAADRAFPAAVAAFGWSMKSVVFVALFLILGCHRGERGEPVVDLETKAIRSALEDFRTQFDTFPAGDSSVVFRALQGQNPKRAVFLQIPDRSLSTSGAFLDPWGTPYRLYFSGEEVLVRSAGPNKRFDPPSDPQFDDYIR